MNKNILILTILSIILVFSAFAQPKIKAIPGINLELGDRIQGQKAEQIVNIVNEGTDTLIILNVKAQCGCTATLLDKKELGPADSAKLSITFDTQNQGPGKVSKQVYITSNDTTNPKLTVTFSANVVQVLKLNPTSLTFDNAKIDTPITKLITITNPSPTQGIKILSVNSKFENLKVTLMKNSLMPGEETQLQGIFTPTKTGTNNGIIEITTDHPLQKKFDIKVYSWVNKK
ncbi:MAG: DUF1573 domain-containing protein [Bacteroidota bacterium]|nr:DUF1573 domain-containing protein [Bacteroidota bacterium]